MNSGILCSISGLFMLGAAIVYNNELLKTEFMLLSYFLMLIAYIVKDKTGD